MNRKAQASLEYLVTYGWAFLVIMVTVGALTYFGVINPNKWLPETCDLGQQLQCQDWEIVVSPPEIRLYLRNNFGTDIEITAAEMVSDTGASVGSLSGGGPLPSGQATEFYITGSELSEHLYEGEKQQIRFRIAVSKLGSGNDHWLTGTVYANVKES